MSAKLVAAILGGVAALAALIALFTPWWTASLDGDGAEDFSGSTSESVRPFDSNDDEDLDSEVLIAGLLMLGAVFGLAAGAVLLGLSIMKGRPLAMGGGTAAIVGGALAVTAALLAVFTWPSASEGPDGEDVSFWDTIGECDSICVKLGANFGWYLAAGTALLGIVAGVVGLTAPATPTRPSPYGAAPGSGWGGPAAAPMAAAPGWGGQARAPAPPPAAWAPPPQPMAAPAATQQTVMQSTVLKCPQCQTRVQAPPIRPLDLVCPNCGFTARLT